MHIKFSLTFKIGWCIYILLYHDNKWHSSLESLPTIPFTYSEFEWHAISLHRHRQRMTIVLFVLYHDLLTLNAGHLYWTLIFCATTYYANVIVETDTREPMSLRSFCRGMAVLKVTGLISQNGDISSNDASSPKKSCFQISVKLFECKKRLRILQLPMPYCVNLNMVLNHN